MPPSQIESEAPHEDSVWGAFYPQYWNAAHPGMYVSRYMLPVEDDNLVSGHDLTWWQTNHPDWILYACKSDGTPTKDLAESGNRFADVPLDFVNPAVIDYQIEQLMIPYLKANGYNALAIDNTDLLNYLSGGNTSFGQTNKRTEYACGHYDTSGNFVREFSGPFDSANDTAFVNAMVHWVQTTASDLHAAGLKLIINHPLYNPPTDPNEQKMIAATDAMVDENGYTHYGNLAKTSSFAFILGWIEALQASGKAALVIDYYCTGSTCSNDINSLTPQQLDWALASYALGNEGGEDVFITPHGGDVYSYRPEFSTAYGKPCGKYAQSGWMYERRFQEALVLLNADTTSHSFTLPANHTYRDIEGQPVSNPLLLDPTTGYVLLTSNGCS
jgi:hypothetical protein